MKNATGKGEKSTLVSSIICAVCDGAALTRTLRSLRNTSQKSSTCRKLLQTLTPLGKGLCNFPDHLEFNRDAWLPLSCLLRPGGRAPPRPRPHRRGGSGEGSRQCRVQERGSGPISSQPKGQAPFCACVLLPRSGHPLTPSLILRVGGK